MAENSNKQNALAAAKAQQVQKPAAQPMKNNDVSPDAGPRRPLKIDPERKGPRKI